MYEEEEESKCRKVFRFLAKTAVVLAAAAGLLWAMDQEDIFKEVMATLGAFYFLWCALFPRQQDTAAGDGTAFVYGADAQITKRPLITLYGHTTESALQCAERYVELRKKLAEKSPEFPLPGGGLFVSDIDATAVGKAVRAAAATAGLLVIAFGTIYLVLNGPWQIAVMAVAILLGYWRWLTKRRYGCAYVYRRFTQGPVAGFRSHSQYQANQHAFKYVEECRAMANNGLTHESDAQLAVMESGRVQRDSKDWPWQEDIKKG
jgi:hypothetical protein